MDHQSIPRTVRQAFLGEGYDPRPAQPGELGRGGDGRRLDAKQRYKQALFAPIVLVRRVPNGAPCAQYLEHRPHILALDGTRITVVPFAPATLDEVEKRILVLAVHASDGVPMDEKSGGDLQRGEMKSHQDHTKHRRLSPPETPEPHDTGQAVEALRRDHPNSAPPE